MKMDIFYDTPTGMRLFSKIGGMYYGIHGIYPRVTDELPNYISELGYDCSYVTIKPPIVNRQRVGITLDMDTATALVLRYG